MTVRGTLFGHVIYQDEAGHWRWEDNDLKAYENPRLCPKCKKFPNENGHDPCIGTISGVFAACCGHGRSDGIILWYPGDGYHRDPDGNYWKPIVDDQ